MSQEAGAISLALNLINNTKAQIKAMAAAANQEAAAAFAPVGATAAKAVAKNTGTAAPKTEAPVFTPSSNSLELLNQKLDVTYAKLGEQETKLRSLITEYEQLANAGGTPDMLDKLDSQITATQSKMISLQGTINTTQVAIQKASSAGGNAGKAGAGKFASAFSSAFSKVKAGAAGIGTAVKKTASTIGSSLGNAFKKAGTAAANHMKGISSKASGLSRSVKSAFKSAFLMAGLYAAFRGIRSLMSNAATQNDQFSATLQTVKTNLTAAFVPIANAVMPYVNMLMGGVANLSSKLASATASFFGTTVAQSTAAAKKLQSDSKKAANGTASIDQLNVIGQDDGSGTAAAAANTAAAAASANTITSTLASLAAGVGPFIAMITGKIAAAAPAIIGSVATILVSLLTGINGSFPQFETAAISLISALMSGLWQIVPQIGPLATNVITLLIKSFLTYAPQLLSMGVTIIADVLSGMASNMSSLIPMAQQAIWTIVNSLSANLPSILRSGMMILVSLITGITQMLPSLIPEIVNIAIAICDTLIQNAPMLISAAWDMIVALGQGILNALPMLGQYLGQLLRWLVDTIINTDWLEVGKKIINGIFNGIKALIGGIGDFFGSFFGGLFGNNKSKNTDSISVPKFASGGIVSGPTLAMVGEYSGARSDPEVISPLSKLRGLVASNTSGDPGVLSQILELLVSIERLLSSGNLASVSLLLQKIYDRLEGLELDVRLYANDREVARSARRGEKSLGIVIVE